MATIEPEERKPEVYFNSPEQRSEVLPLQNTGTDSVSVKVENPDSVSEKPNKQRVIPKPLCYLIYCLLFVCLAPVAYAFSAVVTVASVPVLLVAFLVVRLFQIIFRAENYEKRAIVMVLLRYWTFVVVMLLLVELGIFYPIAKNVPRLKLVMIIGLPITKWIKIICILSGIHLIGQFIWVFLCFVIGHVFRDEDVEIFFPLESISEITGCLLVLWANAVVMSSVPIFKQSKIFGIYTDEWVKVSLFLLIGYNIITLLAHLLVWSLQKIWSLQIFLEDYPSIGDTLKGASSCFCCDQLQKVTFNEKYAVYALNGTKRSAIFILSMVMLLITWVLYFGKHLNTTPEDKRVLEFGTWTLVSLLICSFLWLIKSCILLYWEARSVYDRLHSKITAIGKQLYFFILLSYTHYKGACVPMVDSNDTDCGLSCSKTPPKKKVPWVVLLESSDDTYVCNTLDRKRVRADLINHIGPKASTYELQKAAQLFLTTEYALSKEGVVAYDYDHLLDKDSEEDNANCINTLMKIVEVEGEAYFDNDWKMFLELLPDVKSKEEITYEKVEKFMERAHSSCMSLSNTFISEKEVVKCLNQVMSGIIIVAIFLMWLLLTGLASTKILVIIASPALAATFIFGDTAKGLFQGLIFVYVVHPFDVGDLCLIDGELLEVVRISVWCTTFSNIRTIGEQQQVIYPNSVLALKNVVNHKSNFNWNDQVEFLSTPDKRITEPLRQKIETYLKDQKEKFTPNFHSVEIREIGDKAKIVVHVKHKLPTTDGWTNFECLKAKEKRRYEFAIYVHDLIKQLESVTETPESAEMEEFLTSG
ncbi:mechanosensitive ion channel protein 10-like [Silene latifolia]|uniref:mechanosensitive ion channel protein 10-like n=1 Tax=Silene latifolia TaxID=37657 RepID=UPI003D77FB70